jgi:nucleotidyltransferase AbiEii toxin of type IV toxin-antitoxin system
MPPDYLHNHPEFADLIRIVAREESIDPALVEKDYWIMHSLYGLQKLGLTFEMKGGTSLSKGFGIIDRFSEDIDIRIEPPADRQVKTGANQDKPAQVQSRKAFYDWLAETIRIDGIAEVQRDTAFDDERYRSGGVRLIYKSTAARVPGLKDGVLLEVGFDDIAPNVAKDIGSWAYDYAATRVQIIDNRALGIACYHPGYTFVEKLQAVSTKFRQQQERGTFPINFMRHYYDLYHLLQQPEVQAFIGTDAYKTHKAKRFRQGDNPNIAENQAFVMSDPAVRAAYVEAYAETSALYYRKKPSFEEVLIQFSEWAGRL